MAVDATTAWILALACLVLAISCCVIYAVRQVYVLSGQLKSNDAQFEALAHAQQRLQTQLQEQRDELERRDAATAAVAREQAMRSEEMLESLARHRLGTLEQRLNGQEIRVADVEQKAMTAVQRIADVTMDSKHRSRKSARDKEGHEDSKNQRAFERTMRQQRQIRGLDPGASESGESSDSSSSSEGRKHKWQDKMLVELVSAALHQSPESQTTVSPAFQQLVREPILAGKSTAVALSHHEVSNKAPRLLEYFERPLRALPSAIPVWEVSDIDMRKKILSPDYVHGADEFVQEGTIQLVDGDALGSAATLALPLSLIRKGTIFDISPGALPRHTDMDPPLLAIRIFYLAQDEAGVADAQERRERSLWQQAATFATSQLAVTRDAAKPSGRSWNRRDVLQRATELQNVSLSHAHLDSASVAVEAQQSLSAVCLVAPATALFTWLPIFVQVIGDQLTISPTVLTTLDLLRTAVDSL